MTTRNELVQPAPLDEELLRSLIDLAVTDHRGGDVRVMIEDAEATRDRQAYILTNPLLPTLNLLDLAAKDPVPQHFAVERSIPLGEVTLFPSEGGVGKSLLSLQVALAMSSGRAALLGLKVLDAPVLYWSCEESKEQMHFRLQKTCNGMGVDLAATAGRLHIVCRRGRLDNHLGTFDRDGQFERSGTFHQLVEQIIETSARLVVLDNVAHFFAGNENDRFHVTQWLSALTAIADMTGAAVLALAHQNKNGATFSGSTAWLNAARSQLILERPDESDQDLRSLRIGKANLTASGELVRFRWFDWCFVREEDIPPSKAAEIAEVARHSAVNNAFLVCLDKATEEGRNVSHTGTTNYAPGVFAKMTIGKKFTKPDYEGAMERLIHLGVIRANEVVGYYGNRTPRHGLKRIDVAQSTARSEHDGAHNDRPIDASPPHNHARTQSPSLSGMDGGATEWPPPSPEDLDWGDDGEPR